MTVKELIIVLESFKSDFIPRDGIGNIHCYRGGADAAGFETVKNVSIAEMLLNVKSSIGMTSQSPYSSGCLDTISLDSDCYLSYKGYTGKELTTSELVELFF